MCAPIRVIGWSGRSSDSAVPSVAIMPGLMAFARMPARPPSAASCRVTAMTPPFDAECATRPTVIEPLIPATEPTLSITPREAVRCGQACRVTRNTESSSAARVKRQSSNG